MKNKTEILKSWIHNYVIQLNLCPYAKFPFQNDRIKFYEDFEFNEVEIQAVFDDFLSISQSTIDTGFLLTYENPSFLDFLDDYYLLEDIILENEIYKDIKLVLFHPEYMHANVNHEHVHFSNRSPFATIQLLDLKTINKAVKEGDSEMILLNNETNLSKLDKVVLQNILNETKR